MGCGGLGRNREDRMEEEGEGKIGTGNGGLRCNTERIGKNIMSRKGYNE
jgi:hypothetical protein